MNNLTQLPEKWCVQRTEEHGAIINKWFTDNKHGQPYKTENDWIFISGGSYNATNKPNENNCITFEQFEKWVMKKEPTEILLSTIL
jgi:hypothetical protein